MSQVSTPSEARQAAEEAAHGWHAKLKVEHPKLDLSEKAALCKKIEMDHKWPNPMSAEEAGRSKAVSSGSRSNACTMRRGRSNTDLIKGIRSTLSEKHGVLYIIYREALISEFEAAGDEVDAPGQWRKDGLLPKMAELESDHGFTLPDVTKYSKGFVYIEETAGEGEEEAGEQTARVLEKAIDTHLSGGGGGQRRRRRW
ncbi:hypothetical protein CYMTET_14586 [Cymbomonas tetramitiformis]|uniref:Uncharacterized protein n=1 Tax=Cymbomonas tetramitiformis TaxID=36881 RepID=A0AAE0GG17_9CHLO|nr:hypothetical protein CYMTET_14586 [Cymbomonas tetramitiformis]